MPDDPHDHTPPQYNRRQFFGAMVRWGIDQAQTLAQTAAQTLAPDNHTHPPQPPRYLSPPGALPEPDFTDTCSRCGLCAAACPAECIKLDAPSPPQPDNDSPRAPAAGGLPYIVARISPCVICDELSCMHACPTGALQPTPREHINMGTAAVDQDRCLRNPRHPNSSNPDCHLCIDDCPIGDTAITLADDGRVRVLDGCTGCGVCERVCPTEPPSIIVESDRAIPVTRP